MSKKKSASGDFSFVVAAWIHHIQSRRWVGTLLLYFPHALGSDDLGWRDLWGWEAQSLVPCRAIPKIRADCSGFVCLMQTKN